jgi:hypothetical protein
MAPETQIRGETEALEKELAMLSRRQYEALQKGPYLRMSREDADEYDKRRLRIGEICERLAKLRPKGR